MPKKNKKKQYSAMLRDPRCRLSKKEMAKKLGVSTSTLRRWERESKLGKAPEKQKPITHAENEWATLKSVLYEKALGGDVPAAKLLLQMRDMNLTGETAKGITIEEALSLILDYLKRDDKTPSTKNDSKS
jgi:DNA-binding XRE family transcriptional regulator